MGHFPPVSVKDVEAVLKALGYERRPQKATSHVNWVIEDASGFRKVTVDANNAPFKDQSLVFILRQMGISKKQFFEVLRGL